MPSLNNVAIMGYLGSDPDVRQAGSSSVCNLRIATTEKWTKDGQSQERTEWHRVVAWGVTAENCGKYLHKGSLAYVEGSLETREWTDKDEVKRYTTEIKARRVLFLDRKPDGGVVRTERQEHRQQPQRNEDETWRAPGLEPEDLPF